MQSTFDPSNFLWGVSTSSYQSEGGYNQPGQPQNNWFEAENQGVVEPTGQASDFWQQYDADFQLCERLGINGFRMSLEWAKIQPIASHRQDPLFNYDALDAYAERLASCRQRNIEPVVTLQHFTHPSWLGVDAWLRGETIDSFVIYVQEAIRYLNQRLVEFHQTKPLKWLITINEPNILVINTYLNGSFPSSVSTGVQHALQAFDALLSAHVKAYDAIHDVYEQQGWAKPMVTLNTYCSDFYWSEKIVWDLFNLARSPIPEEQLTNYFKAQAHKFDLALQQADLNFHRDIPFYIGSFLRSILNQFAARIITAESFAGVLKSIRQAKRDQVVDYIAIDYYDPFLAHSVRFPKFSDLEFEFSDFKSWVISSMQTRWWNWRSLPEGLYFFCKYYTQEYESFPILIAENGMALRRSKDNKTMAPREDKLTRSQFLREHTAQIQKLRQEGIPIVGYMHWSFVDNYEWGSYTPRFGLFTLDYQQGTQRLEMDHLGDRPSHTYSEIIKQYSHPNLTSPMPLSAPQQH